MSAPLVNASRFRKERLHDVISRASLEITRCRTCAAIRAARVCACPCGRVRVGARACASNAVRRNVWLYLGRVCFVDWPIELPNNDAPSMKRSGAAIKSPRITSQLSVARRYNEYRLNGYNSFRRMIGI